MRDLHQEFVRLGRERHKITRRLILILPEIYRAEIYRKKGYESIFHYAAEIAGLSKSVVEKTLRVAKLLKDKQELWASVETQGIHKVALVATLATKENQINLKDKIENMSKPAVHEMAKEMRNGRTEGGTGKKCQAVQKMTIELDDEMQFMFLKLKKEMGGKISNKECLRRLLKEMTKGKTPKDVPGNGITKNPKSTSGNEPTTNPKDVPGNVFQKKNGASKKPNPPRNISRYIPAEQKREAIGSGKCAYPNCNKPFDDIHHIERFSEVQNHKLLVPLCKAHHEFSHNDLILNKKGKWRFSLNGKLNKTDKLYRKYRQKALT